MITTWLGPGPCVVDDAPHTTCTSGDYHSPIVHSPIVIPQLPMRDASTAAARAQLAHAQNSGQALAPGQVTTATYKRRR
jgi:hypothetical protein